MDGQQLLAELPRLRRYARALTGERAAADDLVQDTLERAWQRSGQWQAQGNLRGWLLAIMHNLRMDELRRHARSDLSLDDAELDLPAPPAGDPLALRDVDGALARLPEGQRAVLLLVGLEEMSYAEVAQALDLPLGTVMSRLARGRENLRRLLDAPAATPPFASRTMMRDHDESLLLAWVDGQLPAARQAEVNAWLAADPAAAARAAAYREQNELLRQHFAGVLAEPLPAALRELAEKRLPAQVDRGIFSWRRGYALAASLLLAILSAAGGWLAHARWQTPQLAATPLYRQAAVAHAVFVPDARRPVEVDQEAALLKWLSRRLGTEIRAPHLGAQGFELVGGRLLPGNHGPVAQFMYQDASGVRLTLYLSGEGEVGGETGFRFAREGEINVFYWVEGRFGYALSGQIERNALATLAGAAYEQLLPAR